MSNVSEKVITVSARQSWQSTGITVPARTVVFIRQMDLNETWITHPDRGGSNADGWSIRGSNGYELSDAREGALIAMIKGPDLWKPREIGVKGEIFADFDGILYLCANDENYPTGDGRRGYGDNDGTLQISVRLA